MSVCARATKRICVSLVRDVRLVGPLGVDPSSLRCWIPTPRPCRGRPLHSATGLSGGSSTSWKRCYMIFLEESRALQHDISVGGCMMATELSGTKQNMTDQWACVPPVSDCQLLSDPRRPLGSTPAWCLIWLGRLSILVINKTVRNNIE